MTQPSSTASTRKGKLAAALKRNMARRKQAASAAQKPRSATSALCQAQDAAKQQRLKSDGNA